MSLPLIVAGSLGVVGTAIHGIAGELLVLRRLSPQLLPPSRLGGPAMTRAMIHVSWHITTAAFLTVGIALLLAGAILHGDARRAVALTAASAMSAFAGVAVGLGVGHAPSPRSLLQHPGPPLLAATAALAWWGAA